MFTALLILQVVLGLAIIGLVLLQQGKGADMGAAFGSGASGTVFGARGGGSFFTRLTAIIAAAFFINSVLLSSPLVLKPHDPISSVTTTVTEQSPVTGEVDVEETIALPPGDLPDVDALLPEKATPQDSPAASPAPAGDLPELPETATPAAAPADKPE
jgi:preprotein translocase subunit SecG